MSLKGLLTDAGLLEPAEQQRLAMQRFPEAVRSQGMSLWRPGDPLKSTGTRLLLGVAAGYSINDLELMDKLNCGIREGRLGSVVVDVFDMSQVLRMEEFDAYVPGIAPVRSSPILGIWVDGLLKERLQGFDARRRLLEALAEGW